MSGPSTQSSARFAPRKVALLIHRYVGLVMAANAELTC